VVAQAARSSNDPLKTWSTRRVWFVSEVYYPEQASTGYYVTGIAQGLADTFDVGVLCGQPTYAARGTAAAHFERHNGVSIWRRAGTTFDKDVLPLRAVNVMTLSLSMFIGMLRLVRDHDVVVVLTAPPSLPFVAMVAARLRRAKCVLLVHDVYPDALTASGWLARGNPLETLMDRLQRQLYRRMRRVIAIGRDMEALIKQRAPNARVLRIPNWADSQQIRPTERKDNPLLRELGLSAKFVVQYSGNMGRTHGIEDLVSAASLLRREPDIHFLFIGSGAKREWLVRTVRERGLDNVTVLPYQPRENLEVSLNACDLAVVAFVRQMVGVSVPSRMYNIMAAGKPILAVADAASELALVVAEEQVGWVVAPGDGASIAAAIRTAKADPMGLAAAGTRARAASEGRYAYDRVVDSYRAAIADVLESDE